MHVLHIEHIHNCWIRRCVSHNQLGEDIHHDSDTDRRHHVHVPVWNAHVHWEQGHQQSGECAHGVWGIQRLDQCIGCEGWVDCGESEELSDIWEFIR